MSINEHVYVKCLFCQMNKPLMSERYQGGRFEIPEFYGDPSNTGLIMFMRQSAGPGRGHKGERTGGWVKINELNLGDALEHSEYRDIANQAKDKLVKLVRAYLAKGIISLEELKD